MKLAVLNGRATLVYEDGVVDVATASGGTYPAAAEELFPRWEEFRAWADGAGSKAKRTPLPKDASYGPPSPRPRQVFGIGVNYRDHASEAAMAVPGDPMVFTKFPSCIAGASEPLTLTIPAVDWEVELVIVMGRTARNVAREQAWSHVAGLTVGQDLSDRVLQFTGAHAQFNLSKSRPGYGPIGPWLVTPDSLPNRDDLEIQCSLAGERLQHSRTSALIHDVSALVSYLSKMVTVFPGDLVFTGTPAGVGFTRKPPRGLKPGDVLVSTIEGIGELRTHCIGVGGEG